MAIDITPKGLDFIKRKEGYFDKAYLCPAGVWTIGYGSIRWSATQPVRQGDTCTQEQAERLLLREIQRVEDAIEATIKLPLTAGQSDALISIFYNIGIGWLTGQGHQQATFVRYLNKSEYEKIPSEFLKFKIANGKPLDGLLTRRKEEIRELWLADYKADSTVDPATISETDPNIEPMPQIVEPEKGNVKDAIQTSWTLRGALIAFAATIAEGVSDAYGWAFSVAKDSGAELLTLKQTVGPFDSILISMKSALPIIAVIGIVIVVARRLNAAKEGKVG